MKKGKEKIKKKMKMKNEKKREKRRALWAFQHLIHHTDRRICFIKHFSKMDSALAQNPLHQHSHSRSRSPAKCTLILQPLAPLLPSKLTSTTKETLIYMLHMYLMICTSVDRHIHGHICG
jgi:hypothetical protein